MAHQQSANLVAFPRDAPIDQALEALQPTRVDALVVPGWMFDHNGWPECTAALRASRFTISSLICTSFLTLPDPSRWPDEQQRMRNFVDACVDLECPRFYGTAGPRGHLYYDEAIDRLAEGLVSVLDYARERGVDVVLESGIPIRVDLQFVFSVADLVEVCERTGLSMCFDVGASWSERDIERKLEKHAARGLMAQLSDFIPGTVSSMERTVPGDGAVPIPRLVDALARGGFDGLWDIELLGAQPSGETPAQALDRSWGIVAPMIDEALARYAGANQGAGKN